MRVVEFRCACGYDVQFTYRLIAAGDDLPVSPQMFFGCPRCETQHVIEFEGMTIQDVIDESSTPSPKMPICTCYDVECPGCGEPHITGHWDSCACDHCCLPHDLRDLHD